MKTKIIMKAALLATFAGCFAFPGFAQNVNVQREIAALKASLAASQVILKQYEWVETTVISLKGDEKSRQMNSCYYGADGKVQKTPLTAPAPESKKRGLRGRIEESKKEEMTAYMKEAINLVKQYVPPDAAKMQASKDANKVSITPLSGRRVQLTFADYIKPGDSLALVLDLATDRPLEAKVTTYLDSPEDAVTLDVRFDVLNNIATYAASTTLVAEAKNIAVTVENTGYRKVAR